MQGMYKCVGLHQLMLTTILIPEIELAMHDEDDNRHVSELPTSDQVSTAVKQTSRYGQLDPPS